MLHAHPDPRLGDRLLGRLREVVTRPWVVMEVCGGQTHALFRGFRGLLPPEIELLHGLGCPACVTPLEILDRAEGIALLPDVISTSTAHVLRLAGTGGELLRLRAWGADLRIVTSALDAVEVARVNPTRRVVFLGIGLEATAPALALALVHARRLRLDNFSMLLSHLLVPASIAALLQTPGNRVQAVLGAGPACAVTGSRQYGSIARRFRTPVVITGSEPIDLLEGVWRAVRQLEAGRAAVENQYSRAVTPDGDPMVKRLLAEVFETVDQAWRGVGALSGSGYRIAPTYREFDADHVFAPTGVSRPGEAA